MFGDRISTQSNLLKSTVTYLYEIKVLNTTRDFTKSWKGGLYVNGIGMGMGTGRGGNRDNRNIKTQKQKDYSK